MEAVVDASVSVGNKTYKKLGPEMAKIVGIGFGIWLALFAMKVVGSFVEASPGETMTRLGGMSIKVMLACGLMATSTGRKTFFEYFFSPVIELGAGFVETSSIGIESGIGTASSAAISMPSIEVDSNPDKALESVGKVLIEMAENIHETLAALKGAGTLVRCFSLIHEFSVVVHLFDFWDPGVWIAGCLIWLGALIFMIVFPFFLIDACFRMGVIAAMSPLFISAWVFPATKQYAQKGLQALVNIAFTFMMVKLSTLIAIKLLIGSSGLEDIMGDITKAESKEFQVKMICAYRLLNFASSDACSGVSGGGAKNIIVFIVCITYGILLMQEGANKLANYFSDTSFDNGNAWQAAKTGGSVVTKAVTTAAPKVLPRVMPKAVSVVKSIGGKMGAARDKFDQSILRRHASAIESGKEKPAFLFKGAASRASQRLEERGVDSGLSDAQKQTIANFSVENEGIVGRAARRKEEQFRKKEQEGGGLTAREMKQRARNDKILQKTGYLDQEGHDTRKMERYETGVHYAEQGYTMAQVEAVAEHQKLKDAVANSSGFERQDNEQRLKEHEELMRNMGVSSADTRDNSAYRTISGQLGGKELRGQETREARQQYYASRGLNEGQVQAIQKFENAKEACDNAYGTNGYFEAQQARNEAESHLRASGIDPRSAQYQEQVKAVRDNGDLLSDEEVKAFRSGKASAELKEAKGDMFKNRNKAAVEEAKSKKES